MSCVCKCRGTHHCAAQPSFRNDASAKDGLDGKAWTLGSADFFDNAMLMNIEDFDPIYEDDRLKLFKTRFENLWDRYAPSNRKKLLRKWVSC